MDNTKPSKVVINYDSKTIQKTNQTSGDEVKLTLSECSEGFNEHFDMLLDLVKNELVAGQRFFNEDNEWEKPTVELSGSKIIFRDTNGSLDDMKVIIRNKSNKLVVQLPVSSVVGKARKILNGIHCNI